MHVNSFSLVTGRARRAVLWLLMFALVTAQALGLMHRVIHVPHAPTAMVVEQSAHAAHNWSEVLFSGHVGDSDCRLFDALAHEGCAPGVASVSLPLVLSSFFIDFFQGEFVARWAALFDARGPPASH